MCVFVPDPDRVNTMFYYALGFVVLALAASIIAFSGIAGTVAIIDKVLGGIFLMLLVVSLIFSGLERSIR
jgi:uncharacterized membrane protein YtjA (UPF0391 family)